MNLLLRSPTPPPACCSCHAVSVWLILRIMSRVNALSELGLFSVSMPSLEETEGRNCVVKDRVIVVVLLSKAGVNCELRAASTDR